MFAYRSCASLHLGPLAEQGVRLVEQQQHRCPLARLEQLAQVLLGLPDVLAHHPGQVDAVQVEPERAGQDLRGHRLAGAARAREQSGRAAAGRGEPGEAPVVEHLAAISGLCLELAQMRGGGRGEHEVGPRVRERQRAQQLRRAGHQEPPADLTDLAVAGGRDARGDGGSRRAAAPTRRPPRGRARPPATTTAASVRAGRSARSGPNAGSSGTRRCRRAGRGFGHRQERQRRRGDGSPQLRRQSLGVLPRQDRAVQPRAAGLAGRGGEPHPRRAASAAASTATSRTPSRAAACAASVVRPDPAAPTSSISTGGPASPSRPSICTKPAISSSASGRSTGPAGGSTTRPLAPPDQSVAARRRRVLRGCFRSPRRALRAPAATARPPASRSTQAKASRPVTTGSGEQPSHERGARARRRLDRRARTAPPRARASDRRPR